MPATAILLLSLRLRARRPGLCRLRAVRVAARLVIPCPRTRASILACLV